MFWDFFRKLSPTAQYHWIEHRWLVVAGAAFVAAGIAIVVWVKSDPWERAGYVEARVVTSIDTSDETGFGWRFVVGLPDGAQSVVGTRSLALTSSVVDTACLEVRGHQSGKITYKLVFPDKCAGRAETPSQDGN